MNATNSRPEPEFVTVEEIAEQFQIDPQTVRQWIGAGKLPAIKIGRVWRVRRTDLDTMIANSMGESSQAGTHRDPWSPGTLTPPYKPKPKRPSIWEGKTLIRPGEG